MDAEINVENDVTRLRTIFTEVIWIMISESMDDKDDVERLANSSLFLRNILKPRRTVFLFPKVWNIFGSRFEASERTQWTERGGQKEKLATCDSCGRDRFIQPYSTILKLRLVCREWCQAIDIIYKLDPNQFECELEPDDSTNSLQWRLQKFESFNAGAEHMEQFDRHFRSTHPSNGTGRAPFFTRALHLVHDFNEQSREIFNGQPFFNEIPNFLQKYGQHVSYCYIRLLFEAPFVESYARLNLWLSRMPKLKTLELNLISNQDGWDRATVRREWNELEAAINLNPLPLMASMDFLKIWSCPFLVFSELTRQNSQVAKLRIISDHTLDDKYDASTVKLSLQNLKQFSTCISKDGRKDYFQLEDALSSCPLTKLYLDEDLGRWGYVKWRRLFDMLTLCDQTLTELALTLPDDEYPIKDEFSPLQLKLHNISRLKLTLPFYIELDFILSMKDTLEFLDVVVPEENKKTKAKKTMKRSDKRTTLKFFTRINSQEVSNLWDIFPKLKHVRYYEKVSNGENDLGFHEVLLWSWQRTGRYITETNVHDKCKRIPGHTRTYPRLA